MSEIVLISHIGQSGDGISKCKNGQTVYVPYTLANEEVSITIGNKKGNGFNASIIEILKPSPTKTNSPLPLF